VSGALQNPAYRLADTLMNEGSGAITPDPSPLVESCSPHERSDMRGGARKCADR